jgi:hypothetical protein
MKLVASLATRGRPAQLLETLKRHMACMSRPDTLMIVQADSDDLATLAALSDAQLDPRVRVNVAKRPDSVAAKWNRALSEPADVYLKSADDDPYVTPDLDEKILQAASIFPDGIGMVYGRMANASFPGVISHTAKWCEKFGWMEPEYFPYWFSDHWTDDIGRIINRIAFADVTTDQSKVGRTQELREPGWWATWFDAAYLMRRAQALKVVNDPEFRTPDWQKKILLTHAPLIEFRSRWINDTVRAQARQLEAWAGPPDERYKRIKQQAVDMVPHLLGEYGMDSAEAARYREALTPSPTIVALPKAYG